MSSFFIQYRVPHLYACKFTGIHTVPGSLKMKASILFSQPITSSLIAKTSRISSIHLEHHPSYGLLSFVVAKKQDGRFFLIFQSMFAVLHPVLRVKNFTTLGM